MAARGQGSIVVHIMIMYKLYGCSEYWIGVLFWRPFVRSHFEPLREVFEITHYYWLQSLFPSPKVVPSKGDVRYSLFYGGGGTVGN